MKNEKWRRAALLIAIMLAGIIFTGWLTLGRDQGVKGLELWFENENGIQRLTCWQEEGGGCYFFLPAGTKEFYWSIGDYRTVMLNDTELLDGMPLEFEPGQEYEIKVRNRAGFSGIYPVVFLQSKELDSVFLTTESGKMDYIWEDKNYKESGGISVQDAEGMPLYQGSFTALKGRGNYTWLLDKKSYTLKFDRAVDMAGLGADTEWVLLAGASEDTHLINRMVFEMMREAGIEDVQNSKWVDLYLNGGYAGNYLLSQKVKPGAAFEPGSFMVEFDGYWKEEGRAGFDTLSGESLSVQYPEYTDEETFREIRNFIQDLENAILKEGDSGEEGVKRYSGLVDMDSLVKKYVLDEISKCPDGWNGSNYCYYKDGKLYFGPPWDYEFSFGNQPYWFSDLKLPYGLYHQKETRWYGALYQDEEFYRMTVECYREFFRPYLTKMAEESLFQDAQMLAASMEMDWLRWGRGTDKRTFFSEVQELVDYIKDRLTWLDEEWLGIPAENEVSYFQLKLSEGGNAGKVWYIRDGGYVENEMLKEDDETFTGWYEDEACTVPADVLDRPVHQDITLYAGWNRNRARLRMVLGILPLCIFLAALFVLTVTTILLMEKPRRTRRKAG